MQPEQGTRDKVVEFLVSASSFASGIGASPCFHQNRLSLEEWMALAALRRGGARRRGGAARRGAGNAAAVAKALNVSRKRANEMIRSLLAEKLIEAAVGENQKRALVVSAPGIARMEAVADCLYAQIKSAAGENLTQVLRFNRTFRLLNREFSAEAEAATD
jgi:DNA-binding MarR family transcriptional regulator